MSTAAAAHVGAELARSGAGIGRPIGLWSVLKARLIRFLDRLPAHYDDIDPATFKRLPVPY